MHRDDRRMVTEMEKLISLLAANGAKTLYMAIFIGFEWILHYIQNHIEVGIIAMVAITAMEVIAAVAAVIGMLEIAFGLEIKDNFREMHKRVWKRVLNDET